jgi:hypothetical protein
MTYTLVYANTKEYVKDPNGQYYVFQNVKEAMGLVEEITKLTGSKIHPTKINAGDNFNWQKREKERIKSGQYARPSYLDRLEISETHFLHLSKEKDGTLAYTKNEISGIMDVQSKISFQGYIEKFVLDLPKKTIQSLLEEHESIFSIDNVFFATTPEEIREVYNNYDENISALAGSCMRHNMKHFLAPQHPCEVYGAGDLAIAYRKNDKGKTIERALCWPEKKLYSRMYSSTDFLHRALQKRKFKKSAYYPQGCEPMAGARLLRITHKEDSSIFLIPSIDEPIQVYDFGDYLRTSSVSNPTRERVAITTSGWSGVIRQRRHCPQCQTEVFADRCISVVTNLKPMQSALWCDNCVHVYAYTSGVLRRYFSNDIPYTIVENKRIPNTLLDSETVICGHSKKRILSTNARSVVVGLFPLEVEFWSNSFIFKEAWMSDTDHTYYSNKFEKTTVYFSERRKYVVPLELFKDKSFISDFNGRRYFNKLQLPGRSIPFFHEEKMIKKLQKMKK